MSSILTREDMEAIRRQNKEKEEKAKRPPNYSYENTKISRKEMSDLIASTRKWMKNPPVKDDTDAIVRVEKFFDTCEETGEIPTWTNFAMCMGVELTTIDQWEKGKGCSKERQQLIINVRNAFRTIQDTLALTGKTASIPYIWQSKQFLGYREPTNKIEITQVTPLDELPDIASVEAKYLSAIPKDALNEPEDING